MMYLSICNTKKKIPHMAKIEDLEEWENVSKDDLLHKKCRMIKCYEPMDSCHQKLIIMIDTNEPDAINLLANDLGNDWILETYPLHDIHELLEEDHSIVAG